MLGMVFGLVLGTTNLAFEVGVRGIGGRELVVSKRVHWVCCTLRHYAKTSPDLSLERSRGNTYGET